MGNHFVGFPMAWAFVNVPALEPAPDVIPAAVLKSGAAAPGTVTLPVNVGEAVGAAPRLVSAAAAEVAFVPPWEIGTGIETICSAADDATALRAI